MRAPPVDETVGHGEHLDKARKKARHGALGRIVGHDEPPILAASSGMPLHIQMAEFLRGRQSKLASNA